jgi:hypothetical protein
MTYARKFDVRSALAVLAIAVLALMIWAGVALAAGGSSTPEDPAGSDPAAGSTQRQNGNQPSQRKNCPQHQGGSGSGSSSPSV